MNISKLIVLTGLAFVLPLFLWRVTYLISDWSVLFLLITFATLFIGGAIPAVAVAKAQVKVAVLEGSRLSYWYKGQLRGLITAGLFSLVATPILAWQAEAATPQIVAGFVMLGLVACFVVLLAEKQASKNLTPPFAQSFAIFVGSLLPLIIFIPAIAWLNWSSVVHDGFYRTADFQEAVFHTWEKKLPPRGGWIAEILKIFYVIEASKLWLVVQFKSLPWAGILYSVDAALVSAIMARACAYLLIFVRVILSIKGT